jgi:hypothetical protein
MKAALLVENDETIKNKTIDLLITLEAANTDNRGTSQTDVLGTNVKSIINYSSSESSMKGGGGIPTAGSDQQVRNIELPKGTTHKNMDNTLLPAINTILTRLGIGQDPINISDRIDYSKLKIYENGDRKKGAEGGTSR